MCTQVTAPKPRSSTQRSRCRESIANEASARLPSFRNPGLRLRDYLILAFFLGPAVLRPLSSPGVAKTLSDYRVPTILAIRIREMRFHFSVLLALSLHARCSSAWTPVAPFLRTASFQQSHRPFLHKNCRIRSIPSITPSMVYIDKSQGGPRSTELSGAWDPQSGQRSKEWFEQVEKERREKVCVCLVF